MADGDTGRNDLSFNNNADKADELEGCEGTAPELRPEEAREIGEATVDEVLQLAQEADALKEHDVVDEEEKEAAKVEEERKKELEENDGWLKILGNEELMKKVVKAGQPNCTPIRGDIVTLRLEGRLESDESVVVQKEEALQVQLGDYEVITGLDLAIPLMNRGETATVKVSARFAFGSKGDPPHVPPAANLLYEVELLNSEPEKELGELSVEERRKIGNKKRERGNWWYQRGEASLAVTCYRRALEFLDEVEGGIQLNDKPAEDITPELRKLFDDRLKTLNNLAMAQLKLQSYEPALNSVEAVLKCQPDNIKALFRKGKILGEKGETEKALEVLNKAKSLEPNDPAIAGEIARLQQRRKKEHQSEKLLYKRMLQGGNSKSADEGSKESSGSKPGSKVSPLTVGLLLSGAVVAVAGVMAYRYNHRFI